MGNNVVGETITNRLPTVEELRASSGFQSLSGSEQLQAIDKLRKARGERPEGDTGFLGKAADKLRNWTRPETVHDLPELPTPEELQKSKGFQTLSPEQQQEAMKQLMGQREGRLAQKPLLSRGIAASQEIKHQGEAESFLESDIASRQKEVEHLAQQNGLEVKNIHDAARILQAYDEVQNDEALPGSVAESLVGLVGIPYFLMERLVAAPREDTGGYTGMGGSPQPEPGMQGSRAYKDIQDDSYVNRAIDALLGVLDSNKYTSDMLGQLGVNPEKRSDAEEWAREMLLKGD